MALSILDDKSRKPTEAKLTEVLGRSAELWERLVRHVCEQYAPVAPEWNFAGAKYGWSLRLKRKDRAILYLTPQAGHFLVGVAMGEKAVKAAQGMALLKTTLRLIEEAPRYAEGRGVRMAVATEADLRDAEQLAAAKVGIQPGP